MQLLTIVSGDGAKTRRKPVHLRQDGETVSVCGWIALRPPWQALDDSPEARAEYVEARGKHICALCEAAVAPKPPPPPPPPQMKRAERRRQAELERLAAWNQAAKRALEAYLIVDSNLNI
jgi:hypothetical protein